jgi:outer membrane protein assembly factor BamB/serine/threonine protein kinase
VYLGQHVRISSKQAAVKILDLRDVNVQEFQQEAETTERLVHPNIVRLLDFDIQEGTPFLVLDYAPGGSLRARHPKGSQVPLATVRGYLREIVPALQHAHDQNILHRDIKPDNILIGRQGELLLSDFGIALLSRTGKTSVQGPMSTGGTPYYMAPEQFRGKPEKASDQYALAVVVYEWLCGTVPFSEGDWIQLGFQHLHEPPPRLTASIPTLPTAGEQVVLKALSKLPQDRFPHVEDFASALQEAYQQDMVPPLPTPSSSEREAAPKAHERIQDHSTESRETTGAFSPPLTPPVPPPLTKADQSPSMQMPAILSSVSSMTLSAGVAPHPGPVTPTPVPPPTQYRGASKRRMLFTLLLVLLVGLSGVGLSSFWLIARTPTLSPAQAQARTATAAALAYATGTSKQGVMFGFDAAHTRYNPYERTLSPANVSRLKPLWSFTTGAGVYSGPLIAGGMVYVGSEDKKLYAFDATCRNACQPLWSYTTGDVIISSPAVAGGMVYVGSHDNKLYAFDATCRNACQPLWSYATGSHIYSSPAVAGGMVYVGSEDKKLYAFDATCRNACQPLWSYTTGISLGDSIFSSPAVAGGMVYVGSSVYDGKLYAFDATCRNACQPLWSYTTGGHISSSPAVAGGMVYVGSGDNRLYAFDATCRNACQPLWSYATGNFISSSPAVAGGMVYVGSVDNRLYAFDATCRNACQPLWSYTTRYPIASSPAVAGGIVYVGSDDGRLYAFDATCRNACRPLWSYATGSHTGSSPAVAGGMVYVGSHDNKLYAFGLTA